MYHRSHFSEDLAQNLLPQMPDTIQWWVELSSSHRIRLYLTTDPVVKWLTHSMYNVFMI